MRKPHKYFCKCRVRRNQKARGRYDPISRAAWQDENSASEIPAESATGAVAAPV
jgi:hypothetical protein